MRMQDLLAENKTTHIKSDMPKPSAQDYQSKPKKMSRHQDGDNTRWQTDEGHEANDEIDDSIVQNLEQAENRDLKQDRGSYQEDDENRDLEWDRGEYQDCGEIDHRCDPIPVRRDFKTVSVSPDQRAQYARRAAQAHQIAADASALALAAEEIAAEVDAYWRKSDPRA